jgi:hypothetical protein
MLKTIINCICLLSIGICIGILTGLSVSPVIQTVLSSVLGVVITAVSLWVGLSVDGQHKSPGHFSKFKLNIFPLTILVLGITAGALGGIFMRTHDVLGDPKNNIQSRKEDKKSRASQDSSNKTVLFNSNQQTCDIVNSFSGSQLVVMLHTLGNDTINAIIDSCHSDTNLIKQRLSKACQ